MAKQIKAVSKSFAEARVQRIAGETNDCSVLAAVVLTGLPYSEVHAAFALAGRENGRGTHYHTTIRAYALLGYYLNRLTLEEYIARIPARCNAKHLTTGTPARFPQVFADAPPILAHTVNHALAILDNQVHDWSVNNRMIIDALFQVVKK